MDLNQPTPPAKLTPAQKANWNKFVDFVAAQRMNNMGVLDQRNKQVGMSLLQKFNMANPSAALPTTIVPQVQQEIQDYRTNLINQWKAGKVAPIDGVKTEADIMPNASPVDGWPGSKTLTHRFPVATTATKNYGTDVDSYDKDRGLASTK